MSDFLFKLPLLAKHLSNYYLKNKKWRKLRWKIWRYWFFYVLLHSINFPLSKHNRILKIDPSCWSRLFCHCLKAAIVILRHTLTWFLNTNFICSLPCFCTTFFHIYWVSFNIWYWLSTNIDNSKDTVNCIQDLIKNVIFVDICN